jgi:membrane protein YdbS with pleckstrin-like domain
MDLNEIADKMSTVRKIVSNLMLMYVWIVSMIYSYTIDTASMSMLWSSLLLLTTVVIVDRIR